MGLSANAANNLAVAIGDNLAANEISTILANCSGITLVAGASQAALGTQNTVALTDNTTGTATTTLAAISDAATKNAMASVAAQINNCVTDLAAHKTLINAIRSALVTEGIIKGSA